MQLGEELAKKIESIVENYGLVIFHENLFYQGKTKVLRLFIDKPSGGITIKECSDVNIKLNELLESEFGLDNNYSLEVSSPGIDWPIRERKDFQRVIFKKIHVFLKNPAQAKSEIVGIIREVKDDSLILDLGNESKEIKFENISKAKEQL